MDEPLRYSATMIALLAGLGLAAAQQAPEPVQPPASATQLQPSVPAQPPASSTPPATRLNPAVGRQQQENAEKAVRSESGQAGKEEPNSHQPVAKPMDTVVFVNGALAVPGAPKDGETVPAKFSERNAALDEIPTMARPLPLTDEQKHRIFASVSGEKTGTSVNAKPADELPNSVEMRDLPKQITTDISAISALKYVKLADKVLLVQPANRIVVGEITK